jgi:hypothetical protein
MGWGRGIEAGDSIMLASGLKLARYDVKSIEYFSDPSDMWSAEVEWKAQGSAFNANADKVLNGDLEWETINE